MLKIKKIEKNELFLKRMQTEKMQKKNTKFLKDALQK